MKTYVLDACLFKSYFKKERAGKCVTVELPSKYAKRNKNRPIQPIQYLKKNDRQLLKYSHISFRILI